MESNQEYNGKQFYTNYQEMMLKNNENHTKVKMASIYLR